MTIVDERGSNGNIGRKLKRLDFGLHLGFDFVADFPPALDFDNAYFPLRLQ